MMFLIMHVAYEQYCFLKQGKPEQMPGRRAILALIPWQEDGPESGRNNRCWQYCERGCMHDSVPGQSRHLTSIHS